MDYKESTEEHCKAGLPSALDWDNGNGILKLKGSEHLCIICASSSVKAMQSGYQLGTLVSQMTLEGRYTLEEIASEEARA